MEQALHDSQVREPTSATTPKSNTYCLLRDMPGHEIYSLRQLSLCCLLAKCCPFFPALFKQGNISRQETCNCMAQASRISESKGLLPYAVMR